MLTPLECRILDQLDRDARAPADVIGRKLKVSGDSVLYHLDKLQNDGVLECCTAAIDLSRLGLLLFRISIRLIKNIPLEQLSVGLLRILGVTLITEMRGELDLIVWGAAPTLYACNRAHSMVKDSIGKLLLSSSLELILETTAYSRGYLINRPGKMFASRGGAPRAALDSIEQRILLAVRLDARKPFAHLAKELGVTPAIIAYRLEKLERMRVIVGYRTELNSEKIGLQRFRIPLRFTGDHRLCMDALKLFCDNSPAITRVELQVGQWPVELGLETDSFARLHSILDQIRELADGSIQAGPTLLFRRTVKASASSWARILLGK